MIPSLYSDGQIQVENGSTTAVGFGTAWSTVLRRGTLILVGEHVGVVASDPDGINPPGDLEFEFAQPWAGPSTPGSPEGEDYMAVVFRTGASFAEGFNQLIESLVGKGMGLVSTGVPLDTEGRNNDFRFDPITNLLYFKVAGAWQEFTASVSFDAYGETIADRDQYDDRGAGFTFFDEQDEVWYVKQTAALGDWAGPFQFRGPPGGDRYDLNWSDRGKPLGGEILDPFLFTTDVTFQINLSGSRSKASVAASSSAVYSLQKNGVEFGTLTFGTGQTVGLFDAENETSFTAGDELTPVAPDPADTTLSGVRFTLVGFR